MSHPDVAKFARALAEFEIRDFAEELGYTFQSGPQGVIVLLPADFDESTIEYADPRPGARYILGADLRKPADGRVCHDCGSILTEFTRCQRVVNNPDGPRAVPPFWIEFVCPEHYPGE